MRARVGVPVAVLVSCMCMLLSSLHVSTARDGLYGSDSDVPDLASRVMNASSSSNVTMRLCDWLAPVADHLRLRDPSDVTPPVDVVFFTDGTNFDDVVTLLWLTKTPRANLRGIYLQGNAWASPGSSFRLMFNLLHMMGSHNHDIPIVAGSYYALTDELEAQASGMPAALTYRLPVPMGASGVLFSDTLHGMAPFVPQSPVFYDIRSTPDDDAASIPAFFALVDAMADDAEVMIVSTGTLTPLAKMFTKEYEQEMRKVVLPKLSKVVLMAGALEVPGNLFTKEVNKKAEFNIYNDPHAAQWAFKNLTDAGVNVTLVPLDATNTLPLQPRLLEALRHSPATPEAQLTGRLMQNLRDTWFDPDAFFTTAFLWDPSAAIAALFPNTITKQRNRPVQIVLDEGRDGPNQGWTKPCSDDEVHAGLCSLLTVVEAFDVDTVTNVLLDTLQEHAQSAERGLLCL